jgi:hypothetical protein
MQSLVNEGPRSLDSESKELTITPQDQAPIGDRPCSVTTDMSPTGDVLVTSIFCGEVSSRACSGALKCFTGIARSRGQHTLWGNHHCISALCIHSPPLHVCVCVCVCMCACLCAHLCTCVCVCVCVHEHAHTHMHAHQCSWACQMSTKILRTLVRQ